MAWKLIPPYILFCSLLNENTWIVLDQESTPEGPK